MAIIPKRSHAAKYDYDLKLHSYQDKHNYCNDVCVTTFAHNNIYTSI